MKKIALILLLVVGMTLSFVAIGLVILFATGAVTSVDEAAALVRGELPGGESAFLKPDEIQEAQDGLLLLQEQKQELESQILTLMESQSVLEQKRDELSSKVKDLATQSDQGNQNEAKQRAKRLEQLVALYGAMKPADAAAIFDQEQTMSDELVLEILTKLENRNAARILNSLGDDARKARLTAQLLTGKPVAK